MYKKAGTIILAMVLCSLTLGSCGGGEHVIDTSVDPNKEVELEFFAWGDKEMNQKIADDFTALYPNWKVNISIPSGAYYDTLAMYSGADEMPDIFYMSSSLFSDYARDGLLLNLQDFIDESEVFTEADLWEQNDNFRFDFEKGLIDRENGDLYGYIKDISPDYTMIYNKSHIDEYDATHEMSLAKTIGYPTDEDGKYPSETVPMTWEQNLEFCRALTKFDSSGNFVRYGTSLVFEPWTHLQQMVLQQGETLFDEEGYFKDSDALSNALAHMQAYMDVDSEYRSAALVGYAGGSTVGDGAGFKNGEISVVWNGRYAVAAYDWRQVDFEFGVAPSPVPEESSSPKMVASAVGLCLSARSENPGVAYKFLEFFMTAGQKYMSRLGYNIPGNKTIAGTDYLEVEDPFIRKLNQQYYNYMKDTSIMEVNPYLDSTTLIDCYNMDFPKIWSTTSDKLSIATAISNCKQAVDKKVDQNKARLGLD